MKKNLFAILGLLVLSMVLLLKYWSDLQVSEAKSYCESLIPALEKTFKETGRYPGNLNAVVTNRIDIPRLISLPVAYTGEGDFFYFRFKVPWQLGDNMYGFNSRTGYWMRYD